jgi:hypothetical protein
MRIIFDTRVDADARLTVEVRFIVVDARLSIELPRSSCNPDHNPLSRAAAL